jgi:hypothetical protein
VFSKAALQGTQWINVASKSRHWWVDAHLWRPRQYLSTLYVDFRDAQQRLC